MLLEYYELDGEFTATTKMFPVDFVLSTTRTHFLEIIRTSKFLDLLTVKEKMSYSHTPNDSFRPKETFLSFINVLDYYKVNYLEMIEKRTSLLEISKIKLEFLITNCITEEVYDYSDLIYSLLSNEVFMKEYRIYQLIFDEPTYLLQFFSINVDDFNHIEDRERVQGFFEFEKNNYKTESIQEVNNRRH